MTHNQIKGSLLEYLVRQLLYNCGFTYVKPDDHYVYQQNGTGLFFINGKGAAHDADVLMNPPVQMPFFYPSQILFECKAYKRGAGIGTMRNALGLRYDINEFEIITDQTIQLRKNNRRANYAISGRKRYVYQVGVASVEKFNASAVEFAANNKIPLLSFRWLLDDDICDLFHQIDRNYFAGFNPIIMKNLYEYLKDKRIGIDDIDFNNVIEDFIRNDEVVGRIIRSFRNIMNEIYVGLIETGEIIFLRQMDNNANLFLRNQGGNTELKAQIHYYQDERNVWLLSLRKNNRNETTEMKFFVPERIMSLWGEESYKKRTAIQIKENYFSRIYIFNGNRFVNSLPFFVVNIDKDWLDIISEEYRNYE